MKKRFYCPVVAGSALLLSGCATLELFSFGVSGLSYAVTGKSISDHAISTVMAQDCALHRAVVDGNVCVEYDSDGVLRTSKPGAPSPQVVARANEVYWQDLPLADNQPEPSAVEPEYPPLKGFKPKTSPDETVRQLMAKQPVDEVKPDTQTQAPAPALQRVSYQLPSEENVEIGVITPMVTRFEGPKTAQLFAVLGSYNELHFAKQSLAKYPHLNAQVIKNPARYSDKSATLYRVVAGPLTEAEFSDKLNSGYNAWRIQLCTESMRPPPCTEPMLARND